MHGAGSEPSCDLVLCEEEDSRCSCALDGDFRIRCFFAIECAVGRTGYFVHGQGMQWEDYAHALPDLAQRYHVFAVDCGSARRSMTARGSTASTRPTFCAA